MVTQDVDFVVTVEAIEQTISLLEQAGFRAERFEWSVNFKGRSALSIQLSTEDFYRDFPTRAVPADVHGILMRVASLEDTLRGKMKTWSEPQRRQSKRIEDLADIARLVESHPDLRGLLTDELKRQLQPPDSISRGRSHAMMKKIVISAVAAFFFSGVLGTPSPDPFSMLVLGTGAALLCAIPLSILSQLSVMKSASGSVHTLICILVCLVAILSVWCFNLVMVLEYRYKNSTRTLARDQDRRVASAALSTTEKRSLLFTRGRDIVHDRTRTELNKCLPIGSDGGYSSITPSSRRS
jgi:hypothetical protein